MRTYAETRAVASPLYGHEREVVEHRERGLSLRAIASPFGVSAGTVQVCLRRSGFAVASDEIVRRRARARSPAASYFRSICDESRAYWLGFITADGWLTQDTRCTRFGVNLADRDRDHLAVLADHLGLPVRPTRNHQVRVRSNNPALAQDLRCAGITERKSSDDAIVLTLVRTPEPLRRHFIRGLFDGDGSAFDSATGVRVLEFSGHVLMLELVRALAVEELAVPWNQLVYPCRDNESFATLRWRHPLDVAKLTAWLYDGATVWLNRKRLVLARPFTTVGASIYRGVVRRRGTDRWQANVGLGGRGGRVVSAGVYDDEVAAARGRDRLVRDLRGLREPLNLPDSPFCDPATLSGRVARDAMAGSEAA